MKASFFQHTARDTIALGGLAFYILVIARALIAPYLTFTYQLLASLVILAILSFIIKESDNNIARALILVTFSIMFYNIQTFTILASIVFIALIAAAIYLKTTTKQIALGIALGIISTISSYYLVNLL